MRLRLLPAERAGAGPTRAERGSRVEGGEDLGRTVSAPPPGNEFVARRACQDGTSAAYGARQRAVRAALPAEAAPADRQDRQRRGAAAGAGSGAGPGGARDFSAHPGGGGSYGPDRG